MVSKVAAWYAPWLGLLFTRVEKAPMDSKLTFSGGQRSNRTKAKKKRTFNNSVHDRFQKSAETNGYEPGCRTPTESRTPSKSSFFEAEPLPRSKKWVRKREYHSPETAPQVEQLIRLHNQVESFCSC